MKKKQEIIGYFILLLIFCMGCGKQNITSQLYGSWFNEESQEEEVVFYKDGTCKISDEYGTRSWIIENEDVLKLTNYYGGSESATIVMLDEDCFALESEDGEHKIFRRTETKRVENDLETVSSGCIVIAEKDIVMHNETDGVATIKVQIPDYEKLFIRAYATENPEEYIIDALKNGEYDIQEFEREAKVIIENGQMTIMEQEVVKQILDECLLNAINSVMEDEQ